MIGPYTSHAERRYHYVVDFATSHSLGTYQSAMSATADMGHKWQKVQQKLPLNGQPCCREGSNLGMRMSNIQTCKVKA